VRRAASGKDWARLSVGVGEGEEAELDLGRVFEAKAGRLQGSRKAPRAAGVRGVVEREHPGRGSRARKRRWKADGLAESLSRQTGTAGAAPQLGVSGEAPERAEQAKRAARPPVAGHSPVKNGSYPQRTTTNR
jgi:hypothetical protein